MAKLKLTWVNDPLKPVPAKRQLVYKVHNDVEKTVDLALDAVAHELEVPDDTTMGWWHRNTDASGRAVDGPKTGVKTPPGTAAAGASRGGAQRIEKFTWAAPGDETVAQQFLYRLNRLAAVTVDVSPTATELHLTVKAGDQVEWWRRLTDSNDPPRTTETAHQTKRVT